MNCLMCPFYSLLLEKKEQYVKDISVKLGWGGGDRQGEEKTLRVCYLWQMLGRKKREVEEKP